MYILQLMDNYCASFSACIIGLVEITVISYIYGVDRYLDDVKVMLGEYPYPRWLWRVLWRYITPSLILVGSKLYSGKECHIDKKKTDILSTYVYYVINCIEFTFDAKYIFYYTRDFIIVSLKQIFELEPCFRGFLYI